MVMLYSASPHAKRGTRITCTCGTQIFMEHWDNHMKKRHNLLFARHQEQKDAQKKRILAARPRRRMKSFVGRE